MNERGTFVLDRGWFDHPVFKKERYTQREAWAWLIAQAAYLRHPRRFGAVQVVLERGQAANSLRFMAEKWQWKEPRVRRFLSRLKSNAMIDVITDAGVTVVTVRNYDRYQRVPAKFDASIDTRTGAAATQQRRKEEEREVRKVDDGGGAHARDLALDLTEQIATIAGYPDPMNWPPSWCGAPLRVRAWLSEPGWTAEIILVACREAMAKKRDGPRQHQLLREADCPVHRPAGGITPKSNRDRRYSRGRPCKS
jgi:cell division protein FtsB